MRDFCDYLRALVTEWQTLLTGGTVVAGIFVWEHWQQRSVPPGTFALIAALLLFFASFLAWRKERHARDGLANALADRPIGPNDWQELAKKFEQGPALRAEWWIEDTKMEGAPVQWQSLVGGLPAKHCEALCRIAGQMILRSPKVVERLPEHIRSRGEPLERWLDFLKMRYSGTQGILVVEGVRQDGTTTHSLGGHIEHVGAESVTACLNCAADET